MNNVRTIALTVATIFVLQGCGSLTPHTASWEYTGGPYAQNVTALLADARRPGQLLAGLSTGEVFASTDGGRTWTKVSVLVPRVPILTIVQHPERDGEFFCPTAAGIFATTDGGRSWRLGGPRSEDGKPMECGALAIDPWNPAVRYAGTGEQGIYKSTDGGVTWSPAGRLSDTLRSVAGVSAIAVDQTRPDVVYAAVQGAGIIKTTDAGATWRSMTPGLSSLTTVMTHVLVHARDGNRVLYATDAGTIALSNDGGETWRVTRQEDEAWRILTLSSDPADPDVVYAGAENGLLKSGNFGSSWSLPVPSLPLIATSAAAARSQEGSRVYAFGPGLGLRVSTDGEPGWARADSLLGGAAVSFLAGNTTGDLVFAAVGPALLRHDRNAGGWVPASSGLSGGMITSIAFDADSANTVFAISTGGAFKSVNRGEAWKPIARNVRMSARFIDSHPTIRTRMIAAGPLGIFVSTDKGNSWTQAKPQGNKLNIHQLMFTPTNAGIIHATSPGQGILTTGDGGLRWNPSRYGLTTDTILAVTLDAPSPSTYFAWGANGEAYRSGNRGLEWERLPPPWKPGSALKIAYDRLEPYSAIAVVNSKEIYYTRTGGRQWYLLEPNAQSQDVATLHWNARTAVLYVGTADRGIYRVDLGEVIDETLRE
jgi:photosystem II stability/assembly factor-like uncharacterized protein